MQQVLVISCLVDVEIIESFCSHQPTQNQ